MNVTAYLREAKAFGASMRFFRDGIFAQGMAYPGFACLAGCDTPACSRRENTHAFFGALKKFHGEKHDEF